jgi:hypothetical protein
MADMDDLLELVVDSGERSCAKHHRESNCRCYFQGSLNLIQWFDMGRVTDAKSVEGNCTVTVLIRSYINVTIVEIVEW